MVAKDFNLFMKGKQLCLATKWIKHLTSSGAGADLVSAGLWAGQRLRLVSASSSQLPRTAKAMIAFNNLRLNFMNDNSLSICRRSVFSASMKQFSSFKFELKQIEIYNTF